MSGKPTLAELLSMKNHWLLAALIVVSCGEAGSTDGPADAADGHDGTMEADAATPASVPDGSPPDLGPAAWQLTSSLTIAGKKVQDATRSVIFLHLANPPVTRTMLSDIPELCSALRQHACPPTGSFVLEIDAYGDAPGTYTIPDKANSDWSEV